MCCSDHHHNQPQTSLGRLDRTWGDDGWCACPGTNERGCCGAATGDDGLCDRCRSHCKTEQPATATGERQAATP